MKIKFTNAQTLGNRIRYLRERNNISQKDLARALKVAPDKVAQWELDVSRPQPAVLRRICRFFDIEYNVLCGAAPVKTRESNWILDLRQVPMLIVSIFCVICLIVLLAIDSHESQDTTLVYVILLVLCLVTAALLTVRIVRTKKREKNTEKDKNKEKPYIRK